MKKVRLRYNKKHEKILGGDELETKALKSKIDNAISLNAFDEKITKFKKRYVQVFDDDNKPILNKKGNPVFKMEKYIDEVILTKDPYTSILNVEKINTNGTIEIEGISGSISRKFFKGVNFKLSKYLDNKLKLNSIINKNQISRIDNKIKLLESKKEGLHKKKDKGILIKLDTKIRKLINRVDTLKR